MIASWREWGRDMFASIFASVLDESFGMPSGYSLYNDDLLRASFGCGGGGCGGGNGGNSASYTSDDESLSDARRKYVTLFSVFRYAGLSMPPSGELRFLRKLSLAAGGGNLCVIAYSRRVLARTSSGDKGGLLIEFSLNDWGVGANANDGHRALAEYSGHWLPYIDGSLVASILKT